VVKIKALRKSIPGVSNVSNTFLSSAQQVKQAFTRITGMRQASQAV